MGERRSPVPTGQTVIWLVIVLALIAVSWLLTYGAGGTETPLPHLFYVPIVVAAVAFGVRAGILTATLAGIACGPLMPLNVGDAVAQSTSGWLTRMGFFLLIGVIVGFGRNRLLELTRARQEFLSVVSHELRTPLSSVVGFATLLANDKHELTREEHREFATLILKEATEMTNVVDHYVLEGRLRDAALFIDPHPTDLRKIVDVVIAGIPEAVRASRLEVQGADVICLADPLRLRQVLRSMLNNALTFASGRVAVSVIADKTRARVTITDGYGDRPRSRGPRLMTSSNGRHHSSETSLGIGLSVSRDLARRMGGDLRYEVNGSTRYDLTLPLPKNGVEASGQSA